MNTGLIDLSQRTSFQSSRTRSAVHTSLETHRYVQFTHGQHCIFPSDSCLLFPNPAALFLLSSVLYYLLCQRFIVSSVSWLFSFSVRYLVSVFVAHRLRCQLFIVSSVSCSPSPQCSELVIVSSVSCSQFPLLPPLSVVHCFLYSLFTDSCGSCLLSPWLFIIPSVICLWIPQ